jgi:hypothetical protein
VLACGAWPPNSDGRASHAAPVSKFQLRANVSSARLRVDQRRRTPAPSALLLRSRVSVAARSSSARHGRWSSAGLRVGPCIAPWSAETRSNADRRVPSVLSESSSSVLSVERHQSMRHTNYADASTARQNAQRQPLVADRALGSETHTSMGTGIGLSTWLRKTVPLATRTFGINRSIVLLWHGTLAAGRRDMRPSITSMATRPTTDSRTCSFGMDTTARARCSAAVVADRPISKLWSSSA